MSSSVLCRVTECLYKCVFALFEMTLSPAASTPALDTQSENDASFLLGKLLHDLKKIADRYKPTEGFIQDEYASSH